MAKKKRKKKHPIVPKKAERIKQAKRWLPTYTGDKVIKAYREKFRVDVISAVHELHQLGYLDMKQMEQALKTEEGRIAKKHQLKAEKTASDNFFNHDQDDVFAFIAGYTSGGAAYGVRWDELDDEELEIFGYEKEVDDDLPL